MELREQFCKEYYDKNKNYLSKEQKRIEINPFYWKEYARWLETKLQNTSSNNKYEKCSKCNNNEKVIGEKCEYCGCE